MKSHWILFVAAVLVQLLEEPAASAYQFAPISRVLSPSGSGATQSFTLTNDGAERVALTISFKTLERDEAYVESNRDADDEFLAYPAQVILAPGAKQKVRVSWLGTPTPEKELTYRIIVEQVPIEVLDPTATPDAPATGQVKVLLNYRGTLFIRPRNAAPKIVVKSAELARAVDGTSALAIVLRNAGLAVGTVRDCALQVAPLNGGIPAIDLTEDALAPLRDTRVLAGDARRFLVPWPSGLPMGALTVAGHCNFTP